MGIRGRDPIDVKCTKMWRVYVYIFRSDGIIWSIDGVILDLIMYMYGRVWLPHFDTEVYRIGYIRCVVFPTTNAADLSLEHLAIKHHKTRY